MMSRSMIVFAGVALMLGCSATVVPSQDAGVVTDLALSDVPVVDRATADVRRVPERHRASADACTTERPTGSCNGNPNTMPPFMCQADTQCTMGTNGRCVGNGHDGCRCNYDVCRTDSECNLGGPCECRLASRGASGANTCLPGNCRVDADCGAGGFCSPTLGSCGDYTGTVGYYCHTANDQCTDDSDCAGFDAGFVGQRPYCMYSRETSRWVCSNAGCVG